MIDANGAADYFDGHLKADIWSNASETATDAAIVQARRILSRALGRAMCDTLAAYVEGETVRDDFAVYEQAIYLIENGAIANGQGSAPQPVLAGAVDRTDTMRAGALDILAPEALRWLGYRGAVTVCG